MARLSALLAAGLSSIDATGGAPGVGDAAGFVGTPRTTGERLLLGRQAIEEPSTGTAAGARSLALRALGDGELLEATGTHDPPSFWRSAR